MSCLSQPVKFYICSTSLHPWHTATNGEMLEETYHKEEKNIENEFKRIFKTGEMEGKKSRWLKMTFQMGAN